MGSSSGTADAAPAGQSASQAQANEADSVRRMVKRHRIGMYDVVQGVVCDWSLGLFVKTGDGPQM